MTCLVYNSMTPTSATLVKQDSTSSISSSIEIIDFSQDFNGRQCLVFAAPFLHRFKWHRLPAMPCDMPMKYLALSECRVDQMLNILNNARHSSSSIIEPVSTHGNCTSLNSILPRFSYQSETRPAQDMAEEVYVVRSHP
ncbi:hypothetical protein PgNI_10157 [Pyricularia grisea]|uniref:Uncharacterized protein n=1 Tax=Pyricularia grisea TaxID=148305 RepID=A0A6P8AYN1_PYRGI|nr:hypothetical protein PgNI_10157 [Pyricularia grisea]TLD07452.1 hypothetical protein PgNI_10157 [Pyricularia grisea]